MYEVHRDAPYETWATASQCEQRSHPKQAVVAPLDTSERTALAAIVLPIEQLRFGRVHPDRPPLEITARHFPIRPTSAMMYHHERPARQY
jgi:hypothetical protein